MEKAGTQGCVHPCFTSTNWTSSLALVPVRLPEPPASETVKTQQVLTTTLSRVYAHTPLIRGESVLRVQVLMFSPLLLRRISKLASKRREKKTIARVTGEQKERRGEREREKMTIADRLRRRQSLVRSSWSLSSSKRKGHKRRKEDNSSADRRPEGEKRGERARKDDDSSADRLKRHRSLVP